MLSTHYHPPSPPPSSFFQSSRDVADKRSVRCLLGYKEASVQASSGAPPQAFLCSCPIPPFWSYHGDWRTNCAGASPVRARTVVSGTRGSAFSTLQGAARQAGHGQEWQSQQRQVGWDRVGKFGSHKNCPLPRGAGWKGGGWGVGRVGREKQVLTTLWDFVSHHVFPASSQVRNLRMGLDVKQNRQKNVKYPLQQEAGIRGESDPLGLGPVRQL